MKFESPVQRYIKCAWPPDKMSEVAREAYREDGMLPESKVGNVWYF